MSNEHNDDQHKHTSNDKPASSKLPDLKEIGGMAGKLFNDVKQSISEIITDYKAKRPNTPTAEKTAESNMKPASHEDPKESTPEHEANESEKNKE